MGNYCFLALIAAGCVLTSMPVQGRDVQGVSDYAKAHWGKGKSCVPFVRKYESVCGENFPEDPDGVREYDNRSRANTCGKETAAVSVGDTISIYLNQVFVSDFSERFVALFGDKRGEIAVVARVAELSAAADFDFSSSGVNKGRLVYYSEGVQPRQFLNFSQLPIYGPIEYSGKPLVMEFYIMELDVKENAELGGLLSAVSGLGGKVYPPASPILKTLDTIGSGLLRANENDLEFRYHMALLSADGQLQSLKAGKLEYGNYLFVRMPERLSDSTPGTVIHRWNNWFFNQKNGRLYSDVNCSILETNRTYFSVQVNRGKTGATLDAENTYANFLNKLSAEADASIKEKSKLAAELTQSIDAHKKYVDAKLLIEHGERLLNEPGIKALDAATRVKLSELAEMIGTSLAQTKDGVPAFDESQAAVLVAMFNRKLLGGTSSRLSPQSFDAGEVKAILKNL